MKRTLTTDEIKDSLLQDEFAGWSYYGALALAEYLEDYERDIGEELELDPVAIRCEFSEYESAIDAAAQYTSEFTTEEDALKYLQDYTTVLTFDGGIIIEDF